jgi:hypothetical protein
MVIVRATQKLLARLNAPAPLPADEDTTMLGDWYATLLPWRPRQVALLVSETTLLPVMLPSAPSSTRLDRFPSQLAEVLRRHRVGESVIALECSGTADYRLARTQRRSVLGSMNEFSHLAAAYRTGQPDPDLVELSVKLSTTACGPLYGRHVSPDRELLALIEATTA